MPERDATLSPSELAAARERRLGMKQLQAMEGTPLDEEQMSMLEMFEREGWSQERCLAYVLDRARRPQQRSAAE